MANTDRYTIDYQALSSGEHLITLDITDELFDLWQESEVTHGTGQITINLTKHHNFAELKLNIQGSVTIPCDRCLDPVNIPVNWTSDCIVKISEYSNDDTEIIYLPPSETKLNLAQYLYESIILSLPVSRAHQTIEECNPEMIKFITTQE